jgi:hypothetical protein
MEKTDDEIETESKLNVLIETRLRGQAHLIKRATTGILEPF